MYKAYHQDTSLLFQFILSEFIEVQALLQQQDVPLVKLVGSSQGLVRLFSLSQNDGVLTKLKNNCAYFSQNKDLHYHTEHAWLSCVEKNLPKTSEHMYSLSRAIYNMIPQYREDENIVFYILKNHTELNKSFSVNALMNEMYPRGPEEFLVKRYLDRGFKHLIPTIIKNLEEFYDTQR